MFRNVGENNSISFSHEVNASFLIVGGGGAGGANVGGGGSGGNVLVGSNLHVAANEYKIVVGKGGDGTIGEDGGKSSVFGIDVDGGKVGETTFYEIGTTYTDNKLKDSIYNEEISFDGSTNSMEIPDVVFENNSRSFSTWVQISNTDAVIVTIMYFAMVN